MFAPARVGLLPRESVLSRVALPGQALRRWRLPPIGTPSFCFRRGKSFVLAHGWESMAGGDPSAYGTTPAGHTADRRDKTFDLSD